MVDNARRATGDDILIAGLFAPRDGVPHSGAGGSSHGRRGMWFSSLVGSGTGAGAEHSARESRLVVAVSPTRVYLLRTTGPGERADEPLSLAHTFDRRRVAATIHARQSARTLTIEDTWTGERFVLEGERSPDSHVTATMHALSDIHELVG
jgi:hypothetical protein